MCFTAVTSLLTLLHQLKAENQRIEQELQSLVSRRDHLLAVNARLAMTLGTASLPSSHPLDTLLPSRSNIGTAQQAQQQSPLASPRNAPVAGTTGADQLSLVSPSTSRLVNPAAVGQALFANGPTGTVTGVGARPPVGVSNGGVKPDPGAPQPPPPNFLMPRTTTPMIASQGMPPQAFAAFAPQASDHYEIDRA